MNSTPEVEKALKKAEIEQGMVLASDMHITAAVYINDAEQGLLVNITDRRHRRVAGKTRPLSRRLPPSSDRAIIAT